MARRGVYELGRVGGVDCEVITLDEMTQRHLECNRL